MERLALQSRELPQLDPKDKTVSSLYAAATARMVVTSKRRFTTVYAGEQLRGEALTIGYVQPNQSVSLEDSLEALIGDDPVPATARPSTSSPAGAVLDPDVVLAWLLTEAVSDCH